MKNPLLKIFLTLITGFILAASVTAWDDTGHKLTTYIAWEQMSPAARERAFKVLMSAPEDSHLSVFYLQDSRSAAFKQRELFMLASTWADIVRDKEFKNRFAKYHKGDWHYADTFWSVTADGKVDVLENFAEPKGKAVEQLFAFDKLLRDAAASDADKAIALAWILHLGGDIHQPLHTSARVTENDPKGDQGGNLFILSPKGATGNDRLNLHWFWDSLVGRNIPRISDSCDSDYLPPIAQALMRKYPSTKMQSRLKLGKFDEWQQEGFQIASTKLYPASLKFGVAPTEDYKKMAFEIAEEQIALAGYRMGAMLNQIFNGELAKLNEDKTQREIEQTGSTIGKGANDSWIWFKTKAALAAANDLRYSTITVDVENSVVTLRGTVANRKQKVKANAVAKKVEGVKAVRNTLNIFQNTGLKMSK
jgi:hypothetical protein